MKKVSDAFPKERFEVYIIFSKLCRFTKEEIDRIRTAQEKYRFNIILLSERELEPYFIYERTSQEFDIMETAVSLDVLAMNTESIYFDPKPRSP